MAAASPTVQASPQQVAPGQPVALAGGGFPPGSALEEQLFSDPVQLGTTTADGAGNYRTTVIVPLGTAPGFHTVRVQVVGGTTAAETSLFVTAPVAVAQVAPAQATAPSLSRTGADVAGPARVAVGLVALGLALVALAWTGTRPAPTGFSRRRSWPWGRR